MHSPTLDELAARLEKVERQNRRLKRFGVVFFALFLLLAGGISYQALINIWRPGMMTQSISFFEDRPFSFGEAVQMITSGHFTLNEEDTPRGHIGTGDSNYASGAYFVNGKEHAASLSVSKRGAFLTLKDSTNAVYLGPGLHEDGQLLLELVSQDGQQGIRLGLDGDQQPLFEVIQNGEAASLLGRLVSVSSGAPDEVPVREVSHD